MDFRSKCQRQRKKAFSKKIEEYLCDLGGDKALLKKTHTHTRIDYIL